MSITPGLRRLLRIRELEEEQSRVALETALGELNRLQGLVKKTRQRDWTGRRLIESSARSGNLTDRISGLEEMRAADNLGNALYTKLSAAELEVIQQRERFLSKRVQRRQAEALIKENESRAAMEEELRAQQNLDDAHRTRKMREIDDRKDRDCTSAQSDFAAL